MRIFNWWSVTFSFSRVLGTDLPLRRWWGEGITHWHLLESALPFGLEGLKNKSALLLLGQEPNCIICPLRGEPARRGMEEPGKKQHHQIPSIASTQIKNQVNFLSGSASLLFLPYQLITQENCDTLYTPRMLAIHRSGGTPSQNSCLISNQRMFSFLLKLSLLLNKALFKNFLTSLRLMHWSSLDGSRWWEVSCGLVSFSQVTFGSGSQGHSCVTGASFPLLLNKRCWCEVESKASGEKGSEG